MGAGVGYRIRWPSHGSWGGQGTWQGPGRRWEEVGIDRVLGGNSGKDRRGRGLGGRRRRVVSQGLWGFGGGPSKTQMFGEPRGAGGSGWRGSGSPVSCRKSTSVIPQVSTVCPVRTRTPGLRSAQGAITSDPGPTRKKSPEGRALRGRGGPGARRLANPGSGRGQIGAGRLPIGWQLRPSRSSSQQVPEEAEGGAGARAAGNSAAPVPTRQVRSRNLEQSQVSIPSQPHSFAHACRSLGASQIQVC